MTGLCDQGKRPKQEEPGLRSLVIWLSSALKQSRRETVGTNYRVKIEQSAPSRGQMQREQHGATPPLLSLPSHLPPSSTLRVLSLQRSPNCSQQQSLVTDLVCVLTDSQIRLPRDVYQYQNTRKIKRGDCDIRVSVPKSGPLPTHSSCHMHSFCPFLNILLSDLSMAPGPHWFI